MPLYRITAPNGQTYQIEGPEGASDAEVAQAVLSQYPEAGQPIRQSTIGSELKRGAKQLASSVRTGIESLGSSPEEAAVRGVERGQAISQEAGEGVSLDAVKRAYEQRGLLSAAGEVASQIPRALAGQGAQLGTLAAGARLGAMAGAPFGPVGGVVGGALGAGATLLPQFFGSNVERQAAEQLEQGQPVSIDRTKAGTAAVGQAAIEGAGTAFVLGKGVVKSVLGIADDAALATAKAQQELVKAAQRSLSGTVARGAARGAAEIPVEIAQQVLERAQAGLDLTSPDALSEYGESAYQAGLLGAPLGGAGNVVSRGQAQRRVAEQEAAQRAEEARLAEAAAKEAQVPKLPLSTAPGAQGQLFGPESAPRPAEPETDLLGQPIARTAEEPAATPAAPTTQPGQEDLGLDYQRQVEQLYLERERLAALPKSPEVKARMDDLTTMIRQYEEMDITEQRAQAELDAANARAEREAQVKFPALANAPDLWNYSEGARSRVQGELFAEPGAPIQPEAAAAEPEPTGPTPVPPYMRKGPYQYKLQPPRTPMPAAPTLTMKDVEDTGIAPTTTRGWFAENVVGKTREEVQAVVAQDPSLIEGKGKRAKILRELLAPQPTPYVEELTNAKPSPQTPKTDRGVEPGASEPSVGVSGEPGGADDTGPDAGMAGPTGGTETPDGLGLVPAGQPAGEGVETEGGQSPSVEPAPTRSSDDIYQEVRALETQRDALLTKAGRAPATNSPARAKWDELTAQIAAKKAEWADADTAERQREATEMADALRKARERKPVAPPPAAPAPAPRAAEPTQPIPEKLYEPVGTSTYGMAEGQKEILRGPQAMLFPMSKREEVEYAERGQPEGNLSLDDPATAKDERQGELDFTAEEAPAPAVKTPTPTDEATLKAISGKPMLDVAQWAAQNLPDPDQKVIAQRVLVKLRELQKLGIDIKPVKVTKENYALTSGARGVTRLKRDRATGKPTTIEIALNHPSNGSETGTNPETILHELLHAATLGTIDLGLYKTAAGTKVGDAARELMALSDAVVQHFNARVKSGEPLTEFETRVFKRLNNALADEHEVLVWAMTNRDMQAYMESIPYKGQTAWDKFVTFVRDLLGIPAKADTALSEALRVGGKLLNLKAEDIRGAEQQTGKKFAQGAQAEVRQQFQISASTESLVDSMGPLDPNDKRGLVQSIKGFMAGSGPAEPSYGTKFRTQVADAAATVENRLRDAFDGAVRNSLGKLNPMGLYRQAQDHAKLLLEFFQVGGLSKDPATGLWVVQGQRGVRPPAAVYEMIDAWGAKNGYDRDRATQIASRILEGVRLDAMRTANRTQGTQFLLHLKDAEIDQLVREYKADPDLQAMSKAMDESRLAMVDNMVKAGRLSKEQGQEWKSVSGYVPFDRIDDFSENFSKIKKISNKGLAQVGKLPELVGSLQRPVGNVFDNYVNTLGWMVGQTMKTDATVQTLRSLEGLGFAKFLHNSPQGKANTVGAYVGGEMKYWELPSKYDVLAFKDLNPPKAGWLRNLGKFSNVLRKSVTALPPFALKQVTDDVQRAIMTSGVKNPGALLRMSLTNFGSISFAELRGIQHPAVRQFGKLGLTGEYDFEAGKPAVSLLKDLGYKKRGKFETLLHRLDGITRASDLAVRKAIYDQTLKETNDTLLAQTRAREFINFRRRGASDFVGAMVTTIPFFNAYIQGMDVLYRAASGKDSSSSVGRTQARKMFWSRAATVMMLSSLYALGKDEDDERYQEMDLRTRDSNWIIGDYKLPVPGELGALFKVIPERVVEYMRRQGTPEEQTAWEATKTALAYIFEQYVGRTVPVPQAVKPLIEAWTNYSFFTGRELEGIYQKQQDPSMRRASNTSELAIAIANFARDTVGVDKVSPILVDNALNGYFGSTAGLLVAATDSLLNPTRVDRPLHKWALVSNYMYDPVGTRRMTEFYETREKVGRANATLNELAKTDLDRAVKYAEENADALALESAVNSTLEQLERTRAYRKYLNSPDAAAEMAKEEREAELLELRKMEVGLTGWLREAKTALR